MADQLCPVGTEDIPGSRISELPRDTRRGIVKPVDKQVMGSPVGAAADILTLET